MLSDHGFTRSKRIFFINTYLRQNGWLQHLQRGQHPLKSLNESTVAYALVPGRIFLNLRGREPLGSVNQGDDYELKRSNLISQLKAVVDPISMKQVFTDVVRREDLYSGPNIKRASDIIALPAKGIDIKADFFSEDLFTSPSTLVGTHTFDDAFFYTNSTKPDWADGEASVVEAGQYVRNIIGLGRSSSLASFL